MKIKYNDIKSQYLKHQKKINKHIFNVLKHSNFIMGKEVLLLEKKLKNIIKSKYCISVSSGTDALLISLMSLNVKAGDEVITTSYSWISTAEVIVNLGAKPVFVDIDKKTGLINDLEIEKVISKKTKAIIIVSLFGQVPNIKNINLISKKYKIPVIEDGAQSFGSKYKKKFSCNLTTIGCTSFFPTKSLGSYGDGGAIFTNDSKIQKICREIRLNGKNNKGVFNRIGVQGRLDTIQASVLLAKLSIFNKELKLRRRLASYYVKYIKEKMPNIEIIGLDKFSENAWPTFNILTNKRNILRKFLNKKNISTKIYYEKPIPLYKPYKMYKYTSIKNSVDISKKILSLPFYPYMKKKNLNYIFNNLNEFVKKYE